MFLFSNYYLTTLKLCIPIAYFSFTYLQRSVKNCLKQYVNSNDQFLLSNLILDSVNFLSQDKQIDLEWK